MRIIRDEGICGNMFTTALGIDWGIRRCNIKGCYETTLGAIISDPEHDVTYGLCERHFTTIRDASRDHSVNISLDFAPVKEARINDWIEANEDAEYGGEWLEAMHHD